MTSRRDWISIILMLAMIHKRLIPENRSTPPPELRKTAVVPPRINSRRTPLPGWPRPVLRRKKMMPQVVRHQRTTQGGSTVRCGTRETSKAPIKAGMCLWTFFIGGSFRVPSAQE